METTNKPEIFSRYTNEKYSKFQTWLRTKHGQAIYGMFKNFSTIYKTAGHEKTGANLIGQRVRWETQTNTEYIGFKVSNDWFPMMARQLVEEDATFKDFFNFHQDKDNNE